MSPGTVNPSMKSRKRQTARGKPKNNVSKAKKTSGKSIQTKTIRRPIKTTRMKKKPKKVGKPKVKVTNANKNIQIIFDPDSFDDDMLKKMFTMDSINYSYKWELKYLRKIPILANITPNIENFTIIKDTLFERFLPNTPKYDHIEVNSIVSNENYSVKTLDLFNWDQINFQFNSSYIINCGGPVWGLDWCPFTNCLLLSTHKNINEENLINESSTLEPGLIQVYPFDSSTNGFSGPYLFCHDFAPILYMKCCPENQIIEDGQGLTRIGLLAICGCDHTVRLISIPDPSQIIYDCDLSKNGVKVHQPDILLMPFNENDVVDVETNNSYRAITFDWDPRWPHTRMVVGYSDGHVAVFEISQLSNAAPAQSSFILIQAGHQLYPVYVQHVSFSPITSVKWYPHQDDIIICGGYDYSITFYSITESKSPILVVDKGQSPILNFPYSSNMLLFSTEFRFPRPNNIKVLELSHNKEECFLDAIQVICERQLFIPSGSITDVQSCPKTGFFALSDDKGTVYVGNFNERFLKSRGDYFVEVIAYRLEYTESPTLTDNNLGQGPKRQKTIVFEDSNEIEQSMTQRTKLLNIRKSGIQSENTYTHDKILSINRVALSTTNGSLCWLASGGNAGLVRVQCVSRWAEKVANKCFGE